MSDLVEFYEGIRQEFPGLKRYKGRYSELTLKLPKNNRCWTMEEEQSFDNYEIRINCDGLQIYIVVLGTVVEHYVRRGGCAGKRTYDRGIVKLDVHYIKLLDRNANPKLRPCRSAVPEVCEYISQFCQPEVHIDHYE